MTKYSTRAAFEAAINNLRVKGGGDCEELTFHGIIDAITKGKPKHGSPMFVFTDAGAKDNEAGFKKGLFYLPNLRGKILVYLRSLEFQTQTIIMLLLNFRTEILNSCSYVHKLAGKYTDYTT